MHLMELDIKSKLTIHSTDERFCNIGLFYN